MKLKGQCPRCHVPLTGVMSCDQCGGSMMGLAVLNLVAPAEFKKKCLDHVRTHGREGARDCSSCLYPMLAVFLPDTNPAVELDFCLSCQQIWFDHREIEKLPRKTAVEKAALEAQEMVKRAQRGEQRAQDDAEATRRQLAMCTAVLLIT